MYDYGEEALDLAYKAKVRGGGRDVDTIIVGVSADSEITQDKLAAIIVRAYQFADHVHIFFGDEGHRYKQDILNPDVVVNRSQAPSNMKDASNTHIKSREVGTGLISENFGLLKLGIVYQNADGFHVVKKQSFSRWDEWKTGEYADSYHDAHERFIRADRKFTAVSDKIEETIDDYLSRQTKRGDFDPASGRAPARAYILEEAAVYTQKCRRFPGSEMYYKGTELIFFSWLRNQPPEVLAAMDMPTDICTQTFREVTLKKFRNPSSSMIVIPDEMPDRFKVGTAASAAYYDVKNRNQNAESSKLLGDMSSIGLSSNVFSEPVPAVPSKFSFQQMRPKIPRNG